MLSVVLPSVVASPKTHQYTYSVTYTREYKRGKYHYTVDLLFDLFGINCMTTTIVVFICKTD